MYRKDKSKRRLLPPGLSVPNVCFIISSCLGVLLTCTSMQCRAGDTFQQALFMAVAAYVVSSAFSQLDQSGLLAYRIDIGIGGPWFRAKYKFSRSLRVLI